MLDIGAAVEPPSTFCWITAVAAKTKVCSCVGDGVDALDARGRNLWS